MKFLSMRPAEMIVNSALALILFPNLPAAIARAEEPAPLTSTPAAVAPKSGSPAAGAVTPSVLPLPLVPRAKVVTLLAARPSDV